MDINKCMEPQERIKHLINFSNQVQVDYNVDPKKYYRSGLEMVRMANVYFSENSLENAYVLYLKFMTLFLEKIRKHPDFNTVSKNDKARNQTLLREVLPKAESLKSKLLQQYEKEYAALIAEKTKLGEVSKVVKPTTVLTDQSPLSFNNLNEGRSCHMTITGTALRTVSVPSKVIALFETAAKDNTTKNLETCGILAGKLSNHVLLVTHVILPKQSGTSDSCTTKNEEEIFDYQDQHNLITIGWIHTHPTQSAFLSSVDLHTHLPYQLLMPEAIAIVVAPKHNESGIFALTKNYGMDVIAKCRETGFHPHSKNPPLFTIAEHVKIDYSANLEIIDMRTNYL